jgi:hypothetical protein
MTLMQNRSSMYFLNIHRNLCKAVLSGSLLMVIATGVNLSGQADEELYGPENLLKTMPNPFNTGKFKSSGDGDAVEELGLIELSANAQQPRRSLTERLNGPRVFLPDRMVLGRTSEFLVKGPVGSSVAIAMADSNKGAKPILGRKLRLGADRKVMAVGRIPETGVLSLFVEAPIQGDLVGNSLYFEAAVWSKPDFSDLVMASCVTPLRVGSDENGVQVAADLDQLKKPGVFNFAPSSLHYASDGASGPSSGTPY